MNTKLVHNGYLAETYWEKYSRTERPSDCMNVTKNAPWATPYGAFTLKNTAEEPVYWEDLIEHLPRELTPGDTYKLTVETGVAHFDPGAMVKLPSERLQLESYERCNHIGYYSPHRCTAFGGEALTRSNRKDSRGLWSRPSPEKQEKADLKMIREAVRAFLGLPKHRQHEVLVTVKLIKSTDPMPSSLGTDLVDCIRPLREDRKALVEFHGLVVETKSTINR